MVKSISRRLPFNPALRGPSAARIFFIAAGTILLGWPGTAVGADNKAPTVAITTPTSNSTFTTNISPLAVSGTASDNVGVTQVTWSNNRGGSGTATGTTNWSVSGIGLQSGSNVITVTARDAAGNRGTGSLTVTYDPTPPTVTINTPTAASTFSTTSSSLVLGGTAADNVGVTQVTWSNSVGGSGTAAGSTNWSVSSVALQAGTNVITVTARDAAGNTGTDTLAVTYTDTTGPAVSITSPTNNQAVKASPITVTGTASDSGLGNSGISSVTVNGTAASGGTATGPGTASWSQALGLSPGSNTITVVAKDNSPAQNATTVVTTVVYDPTPPTVAITTPTSTGTFSTTTSPITLGGTAADNIGLTQVTWSNSTGGSGTATGTTSWSVSGIVLQSGTNVLTITARDAAGNTAAATLTVTYTASDATAPAVSITAPTTAATYSTSTSPLTLGGTAADNVGVTQVTWSNSAGGSGTATGTTSWTASGIVLQAGTNVLTVTARDAANNTGTATLTVTYTPPSGLVAAYGFNEGTGTTSADATGNGYNATLVGGPAWVTGQFGSALSFNGSSNYATVSNLPYLAAWTVSGWVRSPAAPTNGPPSGPIHHSQNFHFNWNHTNPSFQGTVALSVGGAWYPASFGSLAANTFYYLTGTYDGQALKAYTNGVLVTSTPAPGAPDADPNPLSFGKHSAVAQYFQGIVDEVRIYNRALSAAEIQSDMNTPTPPPGTGDTTPPTVTITSPGSGATVSGTVTVSANASDNVGVVGVQFLLDNALLGAEITAPPYNTLWNTAGSANGSHVLSARARDGSSNETTAVINVTVSNTATNPATVGQWSAPFSLPVKDVHMIQFRTGDVLMWDAFALGYQAYLWTPATGAFTYVPSADNIFCAAPALLADGSALIVGGHVSGGVGIPDANRFDPVSRTWIPLAPMAFARWYPTATSLADGRVLVIGGSTTCYTCIGDIPEVYDPISNTWTQLGSAGLVTPLYPQTYFLSDGRILLAAATEGVVQAQTLNLTTQTWTVVDPTMLDGGSSVMYRPNMILKSGTGSAPPPRAPILPSAVTAYVLDMNQPTPTWLAVAPMAFPRTYHTLTMLPDGNVLATGGSQTTDPGSAPIYAAEIWNPQTGTWSLMSSMQMARTYHETALLLPDGRVLVGGGGGCCNAPDQTNAEIFSPPYLFNGTRPLISSAPSTIGYGTQFTVVTPDATSIASVALIRLGAVTHQMDRSQNYVPLAFTSTSGVLTVQLPANKNLAPPGDYMLFIVNTVGVPSVASIVTIH